MGQTLSKKGLYIDSLRKSTTDTSMYTNLLGTDGLGQNPGGNNKITGLINYMTTNGYNYAILDGLNGPDFVSNPEDEQFHSGGVTILKNLINRFTTANIQVSGIADISILNRANARFDGTSQIRKFANYNTTVNNASNWRFPLVTINTPFWDFNYDTSNTYITGQKLQVVNNGLRLENNWQTTTGNTCGNTVIPNIPLSANIEVHDFIKVNWLGTIKYREVVGKTYSPDGRVIGVDLDYPLSIPNGTCVDFTIVPAQAAPEFTSYYWRASSCKAYLNTVTGNLMTIEGIIGKPNYTYGGADQIKQIEPYFDRIIFTNYDRIPNWNTIETGLPADVSSAGVTKRVTQDLLNGTFALKPIGYIMSAESPTLNRTGCNNMAYNYSGYFIEGRTLYQHTTGAGATTTTIDRIFRPTNGSIEVMNPAYCNYACCTSSSPLYKPFGANLYSPKTPTDFWNYAIATPPTASSTAPPTLSSTYSQLVSSGAITAGQDAKLSVTTEIVFSQSIVRQLNPSGSFYFTAYSKNNSCYKEYAPGSNTYDGAIVFNFYNGTAPYAVSWSGSVTGSGSFSTSNSTYTLNNLVDQTVYIVVTPSGGSPLPQEAVVVEASSFFNGIAQPIYASVFPDFSPTTPSLTDPITSTNFAFSSNPSGGVPPYYFNIYNLTTNTTAVPTTAFVPGQLSSTFYNLTLPRPTTSSSSYTYQLIWTDSLGCGYNSSTVQLFDGPTTGITASVTSPTCTGGLNGSINNVTALFNGIAYGTPGSGLSSAVLKLRNVGLGIYRTIPYDITSANNDFTNLPAATYIIDFVPVDTKSTVTKSFTISAPTSYTLNITQVANTGCWYNTTGQLTASVSGLLAGETVTYLWNTGATTATISNLTPGTYSVVATISNGCKLTASYNLAAAATPITYSYRIDQPLTGGTGSIYIDNLTGSTSPYTYSWVNSSNVTVATSQDLIGVVPDTYTFTVTSAAGCSRTQTFVLSYRCPEFTLSELKTAIYKIECCAGALAKEYVRYQNIGRADLAKCKLLDLKYLTLVLDALCDIESLVDPKLSCEDISNIFNQVNKICDCDCCNSGTQKYNVTYNSTTGKLDATKAIN